MSNDFYMVSFEASGDFYFFRDKENAIAYILENYCNEYPDLTAEQLDEVNQELADIDGISNYAWCDRVWYED